MSSLKDRIRQAFAIDPPGPAEPTAAQEPSVDWLCRLAARKHMTTPAIVALEMCRPLNHLGAMTLHFFSPAVWAVTPEKLYGNYRQFAGFLEQRGSIDYMIHRIEQWEEQFHRLETARAMPEDAPPDEAMPPQENDEPADRS